MVSVQRKPFLRLEKLIPFFTHAYLYTYTHTHTLTDTHKHTHTVVKWSKFDSVTSHSGINDRHNHSLLYNTCPWHRHTYTFNLYLSFSLSHVRTHTKPFIDSLTTLFHPFIFQQRVKDSWMKGGIRGGREEEGPIKEFWEHEAEQYRAKLMLL